MLYVRNAETELDPALFQNPTGEYRGIPFWSWNGRITREQIDRDLEEKILQFVFEYRKGKTILVITHNEKIIHMCDRELCIDLLKK